MDEILYLIHIVLFVVSLGIVMLFASAEMAFLSISKSQIDYLVSKGIKNASLLKKLRESPHKTLTLILVVYNVCIVAAASLATLIADEVIGHAGAGITILFVDIFVSILLTLFGEIIPKRHAFLNEKYALFGANLVYNTNKLLFPVVIFFEYLSNKIMKILNIERHEEKLTEEEILSTIGVGRLEGLLLPEEEKMIQKVFAFNDIEVEEIMTPRERIKTLEIDSSYEEIMEFLKGTIHSYIPVCEKNLNRAENILGIAHINNFAFKSYIFGKGKFEKFPLRELKEQKILLSPLFVQKSMKINKVFEEMKKHKLKLAIVIGEKNNVVGIVKRKDLVEEVIGETP